MLGAFPELVIVNKALITTNTQLGIFLSTSRLTHQHLIRLSWTSNADILKHLGNHTPTFGKAVISTKTKMLG